MGAHATYHLARPRLTDALCRAPVGVIVAGGGYGKSQLAAEFSAVLGIPTIAAVLDQAPAGAELLLVRLRADAACSGLSDATGAMDGFSPNDPAGRLTGLMDSLGGQPVLLVIDEIQNAAFDAVEVLRQLAARLGPDQRLLLVGRDLPSGFNELAVAETTASLGTADLSLTEAELESVCRDGFDRRLDVDERRDLWRATQGWVAAAILACASDATPGGGSQAVALDTLVDTLLRRVPAAVRDALGHVAHLPAFDEDVVITATGVADVLTTARAAGLPFSLGPGPWCQLIGPVQDLLRQRTAVDPEVVVRAARRFAERGAPAIGADALIGAGLSDAAAELLASQSARQAESIDVAEFVQLVSRLPDESVAAYPRLLLNLAHQCSPGALTRMRAAALERATGLVDAATDGPLWREIRAEVARDLVWEDRQDEAEAMATNLLNQTEAGEELTRARLLEVLGRAASFQKDDVHLGYAEERMQIAARIYRAHEQWTWLSTLMTPLAIWVQVPRGAFDEAVRCLDEALALVPHHRINRGVIHTFRAEVLDSIGRTEEAADSLIEAEEIAAAAADARLRAYIEWDRARAASQRGDAEATVKAINAVEALATEWFDQSGCLFLADAAEFLDRVGLVTEARSYLDRALGHEFRDEPALGRVEAGLLARTGDPDEAERQLLAWSAAPWFEPRDQWRVCLLRAYAAARRGNANAAGIAVDAFTLAAKLGYPQLPLIQERAIAEELLAIAGGNERFDALDLDVGAFPIVITLLGRFEVTRGGRLLDVPPGQGRQLLKLIASAGGILPAEQVIEQLWPDADAEVGANRLRTVLNRLRESVGDVVLRDDRALRLGPHVRTDAHRFEETARRAASLAAGRPREALSTARSALAAYRGDLLPDDPYEIWATAPRERLRRHALSLLDLCATAVADVGDLDEAVRCLVRATELAPYEEERYLTIARHLLTQGRRGAARSYLDRARSVLDELNLSPPAELLDLDQLVRRV